MIQQNNFAMNNIRQIYIIKPRAFDSIEEIFAVFDDIERAGAFINRFKTKTDLEIINLVLNPDFISDKRRSPYYISLEKFDKEPRDIFVSDMISQAEAALREEYSIDFYGESTIDQGLFNVMLFAESETEALTRALDLRCKAITGGEWDLAWSFNNLNQLVKKVIEL